MKNLMKKIILANTMVVMAVAMSANALPVFAQTETTFPPANPFSDALTKFRAAREEFRQARTDSATAQADQRVARDQQLLDRRKANLQRMIDVLIKRDESMKSRVLANTAVYGDSQATIIAEIDADIVALNDIKNRASAALTTDELKGIAEELKTLRKDGQVKLRRLPLLAHVAKFESAVFKKAEDRSVKIATKIAELKNQGKDVAAIETLLADADAKIVSAKGGLTTLKNDVNTQELDETKIAEIKTTLTSIKDQVKAVYDIFRQIADQGKAL